MDAEGVDEEHQADTVDEAEHLVEEFLRQLERRKAKKPK